MLRRPRLFLACVLLGVYLLVYVSAPADADGQALLAVAETAVIHGRFDIHVMGYTEWLLTDSGRMGNFGVDGALYAKKGVMPSLALMPLVIAARAAPWLSIRATAMLFNALVTAATALALYTLARRLEYRAGTALALGFVYGLATFAVTYVKTLFGEPLAALLLTLAVLCANQYEKLNTNGQRGECVKQYLAFCGVSLGVLIGINTVYAVFIPALYPFMLRRFSVRDMLLFAAPAAAAVGLLALYNAARFGSPFTSGYHFAAGEGFNNPFLLGVFGLTVSPYRGLFWYNPVLLLSIPGWLMFRRAHNRLAWLSLILIALQIAAFAGWWSWHGGVTWGPRFLLPVLPLMVLFLAPLIQIVRRNAVLLAVLAGFTALSVIVQILGVLFSYLVYEAYLFTHYWPDLSTAVETLRRSPVLIDPLLSPIIGHAALLWAGWPVEPIWAANGVDSAHLLAALSLIGVGFAVGFVRRLPGAVPIALAVMLVSLNVVVARQQPKLDRVRALENTLQPPGMVVAATSLFGTDWMDVESSPRVISINAPTSPDDARARMMWDYALRQPGTLWYVSWFAPAQPENWQERELWQSAYFVAERSITFENHRALWFDLAPSQPLDRPGDWRFENFTLDRYAVAAEPGGVRVSVQWALNAPTSDDYAWFIHLIDAEGNIVAQQDRLPQGGYAPTSAWKPDEPVIDRLFFPLPPGAEVTGWRLRAGFVHPVTGEPLPTFDRQGRPMPENYVLLQIN